jgi:hypothetical protein
VPLKKTQVLGKKRRLGPVFLAFQKPRLCVYAHRGRYLAHSSLASLAGRAKSVGPTND